MKADSLAWAQGAGNEWVDGLATPDGPCSLNQEAQLSSENRSGKRGGAENPRAFSRAKQPPNQLMGMSQSVILTPLPTVQLSTGTMTAAQSCHKRNKSHQLPSVATKSLKLLPSDPSRPASRCLIHKVSVVSRFSHVRLFATPWTGACRAPLPRGFSREEYWSGFPFPSLSSSEGPSPKSAG